MADNDKPRQSAGSVHQEYVTLKEFIEARLDAMRQAAADRDRASEIALTTALEALNKRLDGMNEFMDTLRDQAARLATREALELSVDRLSTEIKQLAARLVDLEKQNANNAGRSWMLWALLGTALTILSLVLKFVVP